MGPVSFEPIEAGSSRDDALVLAGRLTAAGIRVLSVTELADGRGPRFRLLVPSADADRARALLDLTAP